MKEKLSVFQAKEGKYHDFKVFHLKNDRADTQYLYPEKIRK